MGFAGVMLGFAVLLLEISYYSFIGSGKNSFVKVM